MSEEAAPAEAAPTPQTATESAAEPAAAAETTTPPVEEPSDSAGEAAGGVEGYLAEKEAALTRSKKPAPAEAAPAISTEKEEPPAAGEPPETVEGAEPAPPDEEPPAAEPPVDDDKTPDRIRIGALPDRHLIAAATNIAREEKISFAEAFKRVSPKADEAPAASQATEKSPELRSRADVQAEIQTARQERRAAATSADALEQGAAGKMVAAEEKLETLSAELEQIDVAERRATQEKDAAAKSEFTRTVSDSQSKAAKYWPESAVEDSEFSKRMLELSDQYEADPRLAHHVFEADAPFFFAELVAKELGELPAHLKKKTAPPPAAAPTTEKPPTPPATKPAPVNQRAVGRPAQPAASPASGAARTTQGAPKDDIGIDKIRSVRDYEEAKKRLLSKGVPVGA